jgi:hypothetical protein
MASPSEPAQSPGPSRAAEVPHDLDRIAAELQHEVIQRIFSIGLHLESTAAIAIDPQVRSRVEQAINDLDHVIRVLRDAVFGPETRLKDRALRAGIVHLCEQLSPVPDVTFCGPVDGALHPARRRPRRDDLPHRITRPATPAVRRSQGPTVTLSMWRVEMRTGQPPDNNGHKTVADRDHITNANGRSGRQSGVVRHGRPRRTEQLICAADAMSPFCLAGDHVTVGSGVDCSRGSVHAAGGEF